MFFINFALVALISRFLVCHVKSDNAGPIQTTLVNHVLSPHSDQKVILILADGVRWDYLTQPNLTGFEQMLRRGVKAEYVQPIFPSNSYPNWYAIVTGRF